MVVLSWVVVLPSSGFAIGEHMCDQNSEEKNSPSRTSTSFGAPFRSFHSRPQLAFLRINGTNDQLHNTVHTSLRFSI